MKEVFQGLTAEQPEEGSFNVTRVQVLQHSAREDPFLYIGRPVRKYRGRAPRSGLAKVLTSCGCQGRWLEGAVELQICQT